MNNTSPTDVDILVKRLAENRGRRDSVEATWKQLRAESRELTLQLIYDHGYSVNKASMITGHMRPTILAWLAADNSSRADGVDRG